jgi:hypothetical protein
MRLTDVVHLWLIGRSSSGNLSDKAEDVFLTGLRHDRFDRIVALSVTEETALAPVDGSIHIVAVLRNLIRIPLTFPATATASDLESALDSDPRVERPPNCQCYLIFCGRILPPSNSLGSLDPSNDFCIHVLYRQFREQTAAEPVHPFFAALTGPQFKDENPLLHNTEFRMRPEGEPDWLGRTLFFIVAAYVGWPILFVPCFVAADPQHVRAMVWGVICYFGLRMLRS